MSPCRLEVKKRKAVLQGRFPLFSQQVLWLSEIAHPEERAFGMVQIIGEHFAGHGDGGQFLADEPTSPLSERVTFQHCTTSPGP